MAKIILNTLHCQRKQDAIGKDEPVLYVAGQKVWEGKMEKGTVSPVNEHRTFDREVLVELKEKNNQKYKLLGSWTVRDDPKDNDDLVASSSGYHYVLHYSVSA